MKWQFQRKLSCLDQNMCILSSTDQKKKIKPKYVHIVCYLKLDKVHIAMETESFWIHTSISFSPFQERKFECTHNGKLIYAAHSSHDAQEQRAQVEVHYIYFKHD